MRPRETPLYNKHRCAAQPKRELRAIANCQLEAARRRGAHGRRRQGHPRAAESWRPRRGRRPAGRRKAVRCAWLAGRTHTYPHLCRCHRQGTAIATGTGGNLCWIATGRIWNRIAIPIYPHVGKYGPACLPLRRRMRMRRTEPLHAVETKQD